MIIRWNDAGCVLELECECDAITLDLDGCQCGLAEANSDLAYFDPIPIVHCLVVAGALTTAFGLGAVDGYDRCAGAPFVGPSPWRSNVDGRPSFEAVAALRGPVLR